MEPVPPCPSESLDRPLCAADSGRCAGPRPFRSWRYRRDADRGKRGPTGNGRSSAARFRAAADADRPQVGYSAGGAACRAHSAFGAEVADRTAASDRFTGTTRPRMESADAFAGEGAPAGAACR